MLGLTNPTVAISHLRDDEKAKSGLGKLRQVNVIAESGLYKLVMRSDKPGACEFQDWVTRSVLPTVRKDRIRCLSRLPTGIENDGVLVALPQRHMGAP